MYQGISKFKTGILALAVITVLAVVISGCGGNQGGNAKSGSEPSGSFNVIGSNTVTPLTSVWAEDFMNMHPQVNIAVSGPGSGAGIAALINGTTDICQASRRIKQKEIDRLKPMAWNLTRFR